MSVGKDAHLQSSTVREEGDLAPRPELVTVVASSRWSTKWLAEHHVARQLRKHFIVLVVDPPTTLASQIRRSPNAGDPKRRLAEVEPNLFVLRPHVVPGRTRPGIRRYAERQLGKQIVQAERQIAATRRATVIAYPAYDVFPSDAGTRIYWAKDDHQYGSSLYGSPARRIIRDETRIARKADTIIVVSRELLSRWSDRGFESTLVENGCDYSHFAGSGLEPVPDWLAEIGPYAVYVGTLTERIDEELFVACSRAGISVVVVGGQRRKPPWQPLTMLREQPNLYFAGEQPFEQVPGFLRNARVGLLPYRSTRYNAASFPLKLYEYLAAGIPVVSSLRVATSATLPPLVLTTADSSEAFVTAVERAVGREVPHRVRETARSLARENDWSRRARDIEELIRKG